LIDANHPTCGTCRHFHKFGTLPQGHCFLNPPTVFSNNFCLRPVVKEDGAESGCGHHAPGEPAIKGKVNPETPGHAAKAARQDKRR
jgi:hypothetical protein